MLIAEPVLGHRDHCVMEPSVFHEGILSDQPCVLVRVIFVNDILCEQKRGVV